MWPARTGRPQRCLKLQHHRKRQSGEDSDASSASAEINLWCCRVHQAIPPSTRLYIPTAW